MTNFANKSNIVDKHYGQFRHPTAYLSPSGKTKCSRHNFFPTPLRHRWLLCFRPDVNYLCRHWLLFWLHRKETEKQRPMECWRWTATRLRGLGLFGRRSKNEGVSGFDVTDSQVGIEDISFKFHFKLKKKKKKCIYSS